LITLIFLLGYIYNQQKDIVVNQFISRGKFLVNLYGQFLTKALESSDDIALISYTQNIMEQPDVIYTMILDPNKKIIVHHKATEIGKILDDSVSNKIVKSDKLKIIKYYPDDTKYEVYDFSIPLFISGTKIGNLRIGMTTQDIILGMEQYFENLLIIGIFIFVALVLVSYIFSYRLISPIMQLKNIIEDIGQQNFTQELKINRQDEIGELIKTARETIMLIKQYNEEKEQKFIQYKKQFELFIKNIGYSIENIVILTDNENRIVYNNKIATEILSSNEQNLIDKHILDVTRNVEFIELLKTSSETPNKIITKELKSINRTIKIISVKDNNNLVGTIVIYEKT